MAQSEEHNLPEEYVCLSCSGKEHEIAELIDKISTLLSEEDNLKRKNTRLKAECDNLNTKFDKRCEEKEKKLSDSLDSLHVIRQAYHGNIFVGNHCKQILKIFSVLTDVICEKKELQDKFNEIFKTRGDIQTLMTANRFLLENEIQELQILCCRFGDLFPVFFPEGNLTRKMHELVFTIPIFAKEHKTLGKSSEEEGESIPAAVNHELRQLACVRDQAEKIRLVLE